MIKVFSLPALKDNYIHVFRDDTSELTGVVDPSEAEPVVQFLSENKWNLDLILNTHHHWDHVGGNLKLKQKFQCPLYVSDFDFSRIEGADYQLKDGDQIPFGEDQISCLSIPGHTLGHIAYFFESNLLLFTGDTLFNFGCGRIFEGTPQLMYESLNRLKNFPAETKVYCGHEYGIQNLEFALSLPFAPVEALEEARESLTQKINSKSQSQPSFLKDELKLNPFLAAKTFEDFKQWRSLKDHF